MITSEWPTPDHPERVPFIVQQANYLRRAGLEIEVFAFRGKKNPVNYAKAWLRLRDQYDITSFDLVHAQFGQSGLLALPSKAPVVVTFHGSDLQGYLGSNNRYTRAGKILKFLNQNVAKYAHENIVVSEHLLKHLPPGLSVHVIPCGVDFNLFQPGLQSDARETLGLPREKYLVLFGANPQNRIKRYYLAKKAVDLLVTQFEVDLIPLCNVPHKSVPLYMNACDALVLTSKHEGSPTVVKEALACNLPVVAVDVGDVRQRIGNIEGCFLCPDDSPETIAGRLALVLRSRRRIHGRDAIANLDESHITKQVIEVYHSALRKCN